MLIEGMFAVGLVGKNSGCSVLLEMKDVDETKGILLSCYIYIYCMKETAAGNNAWNNAWNKAKRAE